MRNDLTDLLPIDRRNALSRNYYLRLGVVAVVFVTLLIAASLVLLIPTYVYLSDSAHTKEGRLANIESARSSTDETSLTVRVSALTINTAALSALAKTPAASSVFRALLGIARPGIALLGFSYVPAVGKSVATLAINGTAQTRDALRSYQLALQSAPFVRSADLPVSAFARDSDIPFTITVTLAP